jgi:hypothetical protein
MSDDSAPGWHPIETAPRDGTDVLLWVPAYVLDSGYVIADAQAIVGHFDRGNWHPTGASGRDFDCVLFDTKPTDWQPILPPSERGA